MRISHQVLPALRILMAALIWNQCFVPHCGAQTEESEAAKVARAGRLAKKDRPAGRLRKDEDGHVISMKLCYCTDQEIEAIDFRVFKNLKSLWIMYSGTSRSIAHLAKMDAELEFLAILNSPIDDKELPNLLRKQKSLECLWINGTRITDDSLVEVGKHPNVKVLHLNRNALTDTGAKHLAKMPELRILNLSDTKLSDAGLRELKALDRLGGLSVCRTSITDAGLRDFCDHARPFPFSINSIAVGGTKVTEKVRKSLKESFPGIEITD